MRFQILSSLTGLLTLTALVGCQTSETVRDVIDFGEAGTKTRSILDSRIENLERKIERYPQRSDFYFDLATIHFSREDYRQAARWLERGLDVAPGNQKFLFQLGRTHLQMGEYEEAVEAYHEALKSGHQDRHTGIHLALGYAYCELKDWKNARIHYEKCTEIDPLNPTPYYFLGSIADIHGDREQAIRHMRAYLEHNGKVFRKKAVSILRLHGVAVELNSRTQRDAESQGIGPSRYLESGTLEQAPRDGEPGLAPATKIEVGPGIEPGSR